MEHALIIGENRRAVDILENNLWDGGYRSILAARDMKAAWAVLGSLHPNLIIVLPDGLPDNPAGELYHMSETANAPIIVATADPEAALHCLGPTVSLDGPYGVDAVAEARDAASRLPALARAA